MTFFAAWNLLWLLLLVPVIVFFYLLKLKRREVVVSSVLLWSRVIQDVQANAPFQKLRKNLLLLLQLLVAILVVTALARPAYFALSLGGSQVVVILDGSASMQCRDARGSRFEEAKRIALRMVDGMRGDDRMLVLLAGGHTRRLTPFTGDRAELRRAIASARPDDTTTDLRDALLLAASLAGASERRQGSRIYVLSDGAFPDLGDLDLQGAELQFVKVGNRSDNVGIVAMDVRRSPDRDDYQMFVAVRNFAPRRRACNLEIYRNDALVDVRPLELPPADPVAGFSERAEVIDSLPPGAGFVRGRLDLADDLEVDNEAYAPLSLRREISVLLVSDGDLYLEKALAVDPQVRLQRIAPEAYQGQGGFDVVVFENRAPKRVGPGHHLYINCDGPTAPVEARGRVTDVSVLDWQRTHPVMRYVRLTQLQLPEALEARLRPWGVAVAEHEKGVVIAVGEHEGVNSAYVGFPLLKTDFPLRVAFPVFFNNLLHWLAGRSEGLRLRAGQPAQIPVPETLREATVTTPDGRRIPVRPEGRRLTFAETERVGIYTVSGPGGFRQEFAVNLLSRDESAVAPRDRLQLGRRPVPAGMGAVRTARELWRWLILLGLLVLGFEWWVYHRRL